MIQKYTIAEGVRAAVGFPRALKQTEGEAQQYATKVIVGYFPLLDGGKRAKTPFLHSL